MKKDKSRWIKQICTHRVSFKCEVKYAWDLPRIKLNLQGAYPRARQYVGIYRTGAISLKYRGAILKKYIEISQ